MDGNKKFAVIGGGSWATAIAKMLCVNLSEIAWYMRNEAAIEHLRSYKHNPNYLSSVEFDTKKLKLTNDINEAVAYADYISDQRNTARIATTFIRLPPHAASVSAGAIRGHYGALPCRRSSIRTSFLLNHCLWRSRQS